MDIAELGVRIDSSQAEKGVKTLDKFTGAAGRATTTVTELERAGKGAATASTVHGSAMAAATGKINAGTVALRAHNSALQMQANSSRMAAFQQRNLVFQLNDVAVSLASGMNPMMVAAQQGSQISTIYGPEEGGIGRAFKETGKLIVGVLTKFPLITAAVTGLATVFGGLRHEINKSSDVTVGFGDAALAVFQVTRDGIYNFLQPAITAIAPWFSTAYNAVKDVTVTVGNGIINTFVTAFDAIRITWEALPEVMGDIVLSTANNVISGVESMVNGSINAINNLSTMISDAIPGVDIGQIGSVGLGGIENPFSGALQSAAGDIQAQTSANFGIDRLGGVFSMISAKAIENAKAGMETVGEAAKGTTETFKDLTDTANEAVDTAADYASSLVGGFLSDFRNGMEQSKGVWGAFADAAVNSLNKIADSIQNSLASAVAEMFSSSGGGDFISSLFGGMLGGGSGQPMNLLQGIAGFRASGGPVNAGSDYIVGERGPELFRPSQSGTIIPNGASSGGSAQVQPAQIQVNLIGGDGSETVSQRQEGNLNIIDIVKGEVRSDISQGGMDSALGNRFGATPKVRRR